MHPAWKKALVGLTSSMAFIFAAPAWSQAFPQKPITVVVTQGPGSGSDVMARLLAGYLSPLLGQSVVVENRVGASGIIGHQSVAKAPADGYTLLFTSTAGLFVVPVMNPNAKYSLADYEPVAPIMRAPFAVLVANNATAPKTMAELISTVKSKPQSFASAGVGTMTHLGSELVMRKAGMQATHIPYKGGGPLAADGVAGHVPVTMATYALWAPHFASGRLRPLAVTSPKRMLELPDVPTLQELGIEGFEAQAYWGLLGPTGIPPNIVNRMNAEVAKALKIPAVQERLAQMGVVITASSPADFDLFIRKEIGKWGKVVKENNIKAGQ